VKIVQGMLESNGNGSKVMSETPVKAY